MMLGDAGEQKAVLIKDELRISSDVDKVFTNYTQIESVTGIWAHDDPDHTGTEYYGSTGTFDAYTGMITPQTDFPSANFQCLITYTSYKGLPDRVVDQMITNAKTYVEWYTNETFDWTNTANDSRTNLAIAAMTWRAATGCLIYQYAADILQKGYNFKIAEFSVESKTWAGSMGIRDLLDTWNREVQMYLGMLGRFIPFVIAQTGDVRDDYRESGRDYHAYKMDQDGEVY
jgi:hypothetical protein